MADVFVSYKSEDRRRVKRLVEALEADGYSVWWDEEIGGGSAWRHEIEAALNAAHYPGHTETAPGSAFNETNGIAGGMYAGSQPQNSNNPASVSQYDVACFNQLSH